MTIVDPYVEAGRTRKVYCDGIFPVPVEHIAKSKGIRLELVALDDELSGMSFVKDGIAVIVVNSNHHVNRRRFTVAHELAHHIFDVEYLNNNVHVDKIVLHRDSLASEGLDEKEVRANQFAAELLMPADHLARMSNVDINNDTEVQALAKSLKVSVSALTYRLINLGMLR
jgi:Zn-dependent peptidase ImmA (M78 family)